MERKVVRHHVEEFVNGKVREVNAEYAKAGVGEHASGPAVDWLAAHGINVRGDPVRDSMRAFETLTDAICATYPADKITVELIHDWLTSPKVRVR